MNLLLACAVLFLSAAYAYGQVFPPVPTTSAIKKFKSALVTKQASQLMTPQVTIVKTNTVTLTASIEATNELQFTSDLTSGQWSTQSTFFWPTFQTNLPAAGQQGFWRLKTSWSGGCTIFTNTTP